MAVTITIIMSIIIVATIKAYNTLHCSYNHIHDDNKHIKNHNINYHQNNNSNTLITISKAITNNMN
jgi:hypothetical protein